MKTSRASAATRLALAALATAALLGSPSAQALTYDWSGATSTSMSGVPANWGGTVPTGTDVARWNAATYTNAPTANATMTIGELLFDSGNTAGVTFGTGASTLTLNGISGIGIQLNSGSGAVSTGSAKFSLGGDQIWLNNSASTLTVGGTITNASTTIARTLTLDGSGNTTLSGIISNNTATTTLTKLGSGTLTLGTSNPNTFTGGLNVQQGTVKLAGSNSQGAGAGLVTIGSAGNSAILDLNGSSRTINSITTAGTAANQKITNTAATAATVNLNGAATTTFGGVIENGSGGGTTALILNNAGANLTLSGANTYTGLTTVTAGTLKLGAATAINSGNALTTGASGTLDLNGNDQTLGTLNNSGTVTNSGGTTKTLTFGSATSSTSSGNFTGAMNVIFNSSINNTMSGSWSNTGNITFNAISTNTMTVSTGTVNNTGTITTTGVAAPTTITANIGANVGLITQGSTGTLTLSGTNTNAGGVTLATGTLKLGSTTALGATASTFTIAGGTTLDSTVANLVLANNNAVNLNGSFTFTGTNSLNLGTGAVTFAAPLTVTTTANTLTLGGNISGGTIFDITKAGAGTLVYGGNTTMSANQTANITAGTLALTGNVTGGYGLTVNGPVTLSLRGATGNAAASAVTGNAGSVLAFDSSTAGVTGTTRAASMTLKGATLNVLGNSTVNSVETITGALTANAPTTFGGPGANTVTLTPDAAMNTRLSAGSLARANNGALFFRGTNLGANTIANNTAGASNIELPTAPTGVNFIGGGGTAGTQNISIIPWAVGATSASGTPSSFVTYDANGIRPLASGEYDTAIPAAASTNNVKLSAASPVTYSGTATINSLFLSNAASSTTVLAGTGALTVTSGAIFADQTLGGNNNALTISKPIDFGTAEGVIGTMGTGSSKTLAFSGGISGSGGITIYDTGIASSTQAGVSFGATNTYSGNTVINGSLIVSAGNALPNFTNASRTGDVYVNGTLGVSNSANVRMNGLFGNGRIITPFTSSATVIVGDNDATSTFSGTITQTSGTIALTKVGTGTLNLTGTSSTYTNLTTIQNGTLNVVTLNNIAAPNATSSLGRPTTASTGTIGLGATTTTGTLKVTGTGEATDRVINLAGTTGGGAIEQAGTGLLKFTSDFTATGNGLKTLTLTGSTAGTGEIAGAIVNSTSATSVSKAGTGTWTLSGANSYTGATSVSNGTLIVSGSIASSATTVGTGATFSLSGSGAAGAVTVSSGTFQLGTAGTAGAVTINDGTLGGVGTVNSLTFTGASTFGPGNSSGTVTIADGGSFTLSSGTTSTFQFTSSGFGVGTYDLVTTPGTVSGTIAGILNLDFTGTGYTAGTGVTFINLSSIAGTFSSVHVTGLESSGLLATVNYDNLAGDVSLSLSTAAIPESSTFALLTGAGLLFFTVSRRKIRRAS